MPGARPEMPLMPRWVPPALAALVLFGIWSVLFKTLSLGAAQAQALSVLGELPVIAWLARRTSLRARRREWGALATAVAAGLLAGGGNLALYRAMSDGAAAVAIVPLTNLYPVVTVLLAPWLLGERPTAVQALGVLLALGALGFFAAGEGADAGGALSPVALLPVAFWGVSAVLHKRAAERLAPERATLWLLVAALPLALGLWAMEPFDPRVPARDLTGVVALGACLALGNLALTTAYRRGGRASAVTPLAGLYPLVAVPLAVLLLGERVRATTGVGIALALVAIVALLHERGPARDPGGCVP